MVLHYQVEQFLYHEADLLDRRRYREWLELVAEDVHYWMPIRRTVTLREIDREFTRVGDMAYYDDNYSDLRLRVEKLYTGSSWSEDPPSRTRHFVTNVQVTDLEGDLVSVRSAIQLYRSRMEDVSESFCGRREDRLRRHGEGFRLVQRHIYLDHTVIHATNLSSLF
ncbi:MAG: 3-phenylpropionate/cinnamic acid dioxygenase subunit beta [Proteobacteria bacterium]|nr:3-phenylpropionate/cinnamic acid dioxygenase subunit beta [Pseudomonadota bacterium]